MLHRRVLGLAAAVFSAPFVARAQGAWPERQIRMVVPFPPGGSNDTYARILEPKLMEC